MPANSSWPLKAENWKLKNDSMVYNSNYLPAAVVNAAYPLHQTPRILPRFRHRMGYKDPLASHIFPV